MYPLPHPVSVHSSIPCVSIAALLLTASFIRVEAQVSAPLDVNGDGVAEFVNSTSASGSPIFPGVAAFVKPLNSEHAENAMLPLAVGETVGPGAPWTPFTWASAVGYYGIRFWTAAGIHYGWLETYNPVFVSGPSFATGGWTKRAYFNPEPNQPIAVGDESLVLRVQVNPATGRLKIQWNTDASGFAGGLRIQSNSLPPVSTWTTVQTVASGFEAEVKVSGDAAIFRVVR